MNRSLSNATNGGTEHVLMWRSGQGGAQPDASYTQVANPFPAPAMHGWTLALGAQDLTGDGLPDIYIANDFGADRLLHNVSTPGHLRFVLTHGIRHFTTPKSQVLGNDSFKGMGVAFTDLTLSGVPSILVSNITEPYALEESNFAFVATQNPVFGSGGAAYYDNWSEALGLSRSGWSWDIKAGDFDESGRPQIMQATGFVSGTTNRWPELQELAMSNDYTMPDPSVWPRMIPGDDVSGQDSNPFYVLGPGGQYVNVAKQIGVADTGVSRSMALGDVFHNGHLDLAVANQWRQSYFYLNQSPLQHPYLGLRLVRPASAGSNCAAPPAGTTATTTAIGAEVTLLSGTTGIRIGQIYPANGHGGVSAPELLFALTQNPQTAKIQVRWRDGCGTLHTAITTVADGWHSLLLGNDGSVQEVLPS
jgi:hypothetical protein